MRSHDTLRANGEMNHHVPLAGPVQYPSRIDLPIEPYTLGAWLGDGTTTAAAITSCDDEILEQISGDGYAVRRLVYAPHLYSIGGTGRTRDVATGRYARNASLSSRLRDLGMLDGKYVPRPYLEAGVGQRLALLQGLMDTDGYVDDVAGRCEFTSVERRARRRRRRVGSEPRVPAGQVRGASDARTASTTARSTVSSSRRIVRSSGSAASSPARSPPTLDSTDSARSMSSGKSRRSRCAASRSRHPERHVPGFALVHPDPQQLARPPRPAHPLDRRLRRPGLEGQPDPGAVERGQPADRALLRDADRPDQLLQDVERGRSAVRLARARSRSTRASRSRRRPRSIATSTPAATGDPKRS